MTRFLDILVCALFSYLAVTNIQDTWTSLAACALFGAFYGFMKGMLR